MSKISLTRPQRRTLVDLMCPNPGGPIIPIKQFIVKRLINKGVIEMYEDSYRLTEEGKKEYDKITLSYELYCFRYRTWNGKRAIR